MMKGNNRTLQALLFLPLHSSVILLHPFWCPGRQNSMGCINQALLPFAFCLNSVNIRPRGEGSRTSLFLWFPSCLAGDWQWMYSILLRFIERKTSQIDGCFGLLFGNYILTIQFQVFGLSLLQEYFHAYMSFFVILYTYEQSQIRSLQ